MDLIFSLILITVVFFLSFIEYTQHQTFLTPFNVISWPLVVIVIYVNTTGGILSNYFPVTLRAQFFILLNLLVFFFSGQVIWFMLKSRFRRDIGFTVQNHIQNHIKKYRHIYVLLLCGSIIASVFQITSIMDSMNLSFLKKKGFEEHYRSGILAHLRILGYPSFILLSSYYLRKRNIFVKALMLIMIVLVFASMVKYHVILLVLSSGYFWLFNKESKKVPIKKIVFLVLIIFLLFYLTYFVQLTAFKGIDYAFSKSVLLAKHLEYYLVGGPIALNSFLQPEFECIWPWESLFSVPINVFKAISGDTDYIKIHYSQPRVTVGAKKSVPIGTLFSVIYFSLGYWGTLMYMFFLGFLVYILMNRALIKRNVVYRLLFCWILAVLTVSFFGHHFHLLLIWEVAFFIILLPSTFKFFSLFLSFRKMKENTEGVAPPT